MPVTVPTIPLPAVWCVGCSGGSLASSWRTGDKVTCYLKVGSDQKNNTTSNCTIISGLDSDGDVRVRYDDGSWDGITQYIQAGWVVAKGWKVVRKCSKPGFCEFDAGSLLEVSGASADWCNGVFVATREKFKSGAPLFTKIASGGGPDGFRHMLEGWSSGVHPRTGQYEYSRTSEIYIWKDYYHGEDCWRIGMDGDISAYWAPGQSDRTVDMGMKGPPEYGWRVNENNTGRCFPEAGYGSAPSVKII